MLLCIPQLLQPQEVQQLRDLAVEGRFAVRTIIVGAGAIYFARSWLDSERAALEALRSIGDDDPEVKFVLVAERSLVFPIAFGALSAAILVWLVYVLWRVKKGDYG